MPGGGRARKSSGEHHVDMMLIMGLGL
jgi:hypothetical protein